jgi:hypothetical protein
MKKLLIGLLICGNAYAADIAICTGQYALCAASPTTPTGKTMQVQGKTYREGVAVCPVLTGAAVANLALMNGSCKAPKGTVWSLFGVPPVTSFPQAPSWETAPAVARTFTIGETPTTGMSNMWSFPCKIQAQKINGVTLASCYGPIMESPFSNNHVKPRQLGFTQAPVGATWPVGGNAPQK